MHKKQIIYIGLIFLLTIALMGCNSEEEKVLPKISDEAVEMAKDQIKSDFVKDASIQIDDDKIILAIIVSPSVNEEFSKDVGERFARLLATFTSVTNKDVDLKGPSNESLGEIYDYYDLQIIVGSGPENVIVHGAKSSGSRVLVW